MENNENHLALELLQEIKASARRWFVMATVELVVIATLILILLLVPQETVEVETDDGNANYIGNDNIGGIYNGKNQGSEEMAWSEENQSEGKEVD